MIMLAYMTYTATTTLRVTTKHEHELRQNLSHQRLKDTCISLRPVNEAALQLPYSMKLCPDECQKASRAYARGIKNLQRVDLKLISKEHLSLCNDANDIFSSLDTFNLFQGPPRASCLTLATV
jgi:hypothetical protein